MILASHGLIASQITLGPVATAATSIGVTSFTANWNAYTGAQYYLLDVSTSSSFSTFVYQDQVVLAPTTAYVVIGLTENTTYYYRVRAAVGVDTDAVSFFSRVYTAGGALSYTEVTATETLVADLKANSLWTPMKAIYPMIGASAAACAQNLKSSSFTGTFTSGWTFASTGVTPNGTSAYMDTALSPNGNLSLNSTHLSYYSRTNTTNSTFVEMGCAIAGSETYILYEFANISYIGNNCVANFALPNITNPIGLYINTRSSSSIVKRFLRNTMASYSINSTSLPTRNIFVGGYNAASGIQYTQRQCAFASIGDGLTDTQASNFYTAVQAFQTTLSRQV